MKGASISPRWVYPVESQKRRNRAQRISLCSKSQCVEMMMDTLELDDSSSAILILYDLCKGTDSMGPRQHLRNGDH